MESPINEQKLRVGLLKAGATGGLGSLLREGQLSGDLAGYLDAHVELIDVDEPSPPAEVVGALGLLIIDGKIPDPEGHEGRVAAVASPLTDPNLEWLGYALVALQKDVPLVLHDFDYNGRLPEWIEPVIASVLGGATKVLVTSDSAEARIRSLRPDANVGRIAHPLSELAGGQRARSAIQSSSGDDAPVAQYWLLDTTLVGRDHGVTFSTVTRCAGEKNVRLVRVRDEPPVTEELPDPSLVQLGSLQFDDAVALTALASAVVLAGRDLAVAAAALGVPSFPRVDRISGSWVEPPPDLVADHLLIDAVETSPPDNTSETTPSVERGWRSVREALAIPATPPPVIDTLLSELPTSLAKLAKRARSAQLDRLALKPEVAKAQRRAQLLQESLRDMRSENSHQRGRLERADAARLAASEAMSDYRRTIRKAEDRIERLTQRVIELRETSEAERATAAKAMRNLQKEKRDLASQLKQVEGDRARYAEQATLISAQYDRLRNRRIVRTGVAVAGWFGRIRGDRRPLD